MDLDHETNATDGPQPFFDFPETDNYPFDFGTDYNASLDPFPLKQESYSPGSVEETLFDSPSASPHPVVPEDPLSFTSMPLDMPANAEEVLFDDPIPVDGQPAFSAPLEGNSPFSQHDGSYVESRDSDSEGQVKRGRKRKAPVSPVGNEKRSRMRFEPGKVVPKDDLHKMTADELEEYAQYIQDSNLPNAEKNEIRKQLRLVKNRESAQASRLRKKNYIDDLERRVSLLQSENTNLRQNINTLHNENTQLKSEVVYLKGVVNNSGLSKVLTQGASFFSKLSQQQAGHQQTSSGGKPAPALNARTTGVVLMVMLFSFGLLFNSPGLNQLAPLPGKALVQDAAQHRVLNHSNYKPTSEVRDVLAVLEQSEMPTQRIRQLVEKQRAMPDSTSHKVVDDRAGASKSATQSGAHTPGVELTEDALVMQWKANTTYLLCPEVKRLSPPSDAPSNDPALPMQISFLIPSDALKEGAGDGAAGIPRSQRDLLEVTCQVVDVVARV